MKNTKIDYVFLGSSRVQNHIVTKLVEKETGKKALNLGVQGGKLDDVSLLLKLLKQNNNTFEKVLIQVDYLYNYESPSTIVGCESLPYIRSNDIVKKHVKENNPDYEQNHNVPFYRYNVNDFKLGFREFFSSLINKKARLDLSDGFEAKNQKFRKSNYKLPQNIADKNDDLIAIQTFCKENKIEVVYFCAPFCKYAGNLEYVEKLKVKIPELRDFSKAISDDDYFKDCAHLNGKGAELFTKMLVDSCLVKK
ncbi:hypothetical protein [Flavobacterium sp.]|uniref:hypothetical protein n=1 Tax=Flavobacterium sp. TaxID=239 RepID=UPI0028BD568D|nr:hypothetical protein [Flavobacterium sp.]